MPGRSRGLAIVLFGAGQLLYAFRCPFWSGGRQAAIQRLPIGRAVLQHGPAGPFFYLKEVAVMPESKRRLRERVNSLWESERHFSWLIGEILLILWGPDWGFPSPTDDAELAQRSGSPFTRDALDRSHRTRMNIELAFFARSKWRARVIAVTLAFLLIVAGIVRVFIPEFPYMIFPALGAVAIGYWATIRQIEQRLVDKWDANDKATRDYAAFERDRQIARLRGLESLMDRYQADIDSGRSPLATPERFTHWRNEASIAALHLADF